jgi:hypothetical protein
MTDFDEFLRKRSEAKSAEIGDSALLRREANSEWQQLKLQLKKIADGKVLDSKQFEWNKYPASYPDFLILGDVSVTFVGIATSGSASQDYRIVFSRRPPNASELWIDDEPIPKKLLRTQLETDGGVFYWTVRESGLKLTTEKFAAYLAMELVEYHDEYVRANKAKFYGG